jgi:hypothetical protein
LPDETIYIFDGTAMLHLSYYRWVLFMRFELMFPLNMRLLF